MRRVFLALLLPALLIACGDKETVQEGDSETASIVHGGKLYDKFWKVSDAAQPETTHPLWEQRPDTSSNSRTGHDTWRCKECHGWDYRGAEGAYAGGSHKTGFGGVVGTKLDATALRTSLAETHGYKEAGLSDKDLDSLVMFLQKGLVDTTRYIDADGKFTGDAAKGKSLYLNGIGDNKACATCHGPAGLKVPDGSPPDYDDFVGKIAHKNPWEFLHKVRFGHPGAKMPAAHGAGLSIEQLIDLCAYSQTLPTQR